MLIVILAAGAWRISKWHAAPTILNREPEKLPRKNLGKGRFQFLITDN